MKKVKGLDIVSYYKCGYCDIPDVYETVELARKHQEECIMILENKSCATCKHIEVIKDAPLLHNAKPKNNMQLKVALGSYCEGKCGKFNKVLSEEDILTIGNKCWEEYDSDDEDIVTHYTDRYKKHMETMSEYMEEIDKMESEYHDDKEAVS